MTTKKRTKIEPPVMQPISITGCSVNNVSTGDFAANEIELIRAVAAGFEVLLKLSARPVNAIGMQFVTAPRPDVITNLKVLK